MKEMPGKNYALHGIIWTGSIILGYGIGMLLERIEAGDAIGVGLGLVLTALFYQEVY